MKRITGLIVSMAIVTAGLVLAKEDELRLEARLVAAAEHGDISGQVRFRDHGGRRQLSAQIEGFELGEMYDVVISGVIVGKMTIDASGVGELDYDTNFEPNEDDPASVFPPNFPALDGGERVDIGVLSGTLQRK